MLKKLIVTSLLGVALSAGSALAAMNSSLSLPSADADTDGDGTVELSGIPGNGYSSMCFDCHTANPFQKYADESTNRSAGMPHSTQAKATHMGSHFVGASTNSGGGITPVSTVNGGVRDRGEYFKIAAWAPGGYSKYGNTGDNKSYAYNTSAITSSGTGTQTNKATLAGYDLICESCHSITLHADGLQSYLLGAAADPVSATGKVTTESTGMCEGCHGDMTTDWYRTADAQMGGNNQPERNNHHVLSYNEAERLNTSNNDAETISNGKAALSAQVFSIADGSDPSNAVKGTLWTRANSITGTDNRAMTNTPTYSGAMLQVKFRVKTAWDGDLVGKAGSGYFNCSDCHAYGHGGQTNAGARILRDSEASSSHESFTGTVVTGLERLTDLDGAATTVFVDEQAYCQACHVQQ